MKNFLRNFEINPSCDGRVRITGQGRRQGKVIPVWITHYPLLPTTITEPSSPTAQPGGQGAIKLKNGEKPGPGRSNVSVTTPTILHGYKSARRGVTSSIIDGQILCGHPTISGPGGIETQTFLRPAGDNCNNRKFEPVGFKLSCLVSDEGLNTRS